MRETLHVAFNNADTAARAVGALIDHGVEPTDISVFIKDPPADWRKHMKTGSDVADQATEGITVTTTDDALNAGAKGAGIGLGVGILAALASLTIPGAGVVIGGGALGAALGGAVATTAAGAIAGGTIGYLKDQGIDEDTAMGISQHLEGGGALVSVTSPSNNVPIDRVRALLSKYVGQDAMATNTRTELPPMFVSHPRLL